MLFSIYRSEQKLKMTSKMLLKGSFSRILDNSNFGFFHKRTSKLLFSYWMSWLIKEKLKVRIVICLSILCFCRHGRQRWTHISEYRKILNTGKWKCGLYDIRFLIVDCYFFFSFSLVYSQFWWSHIEYIVMFLLPPAGHPPSLYILDQVVENCKRFLLNQDALPL